MAIYTKTLPVTGPSLANFAFPKGEAVLVVGDVHGQNEAFRKLLIQFARMPTPGKRRTLVLLGDIIDRGPDCLGALRTALDEAEVLAEADLKVILPGNHELLMADALHLAAHGGDVHASYQTSARIWTKHGGMSFMLDSFEAAGLEMPEPRLEAMTAFAEMLPHPGFASFGEMVASWPSHFELGDLLCVHAGLAPGVPISQTLDMSQDDHRPLGPMDTRRDRHWAWIRHAFLDWQGGWPRTGRAGEDGVLVLHGHSVPHGLRPSLIEYDENVDAAFNCMARHARICLDGGAKDDTGVAGAIVTADGVRLVFQHC